MLRIVTEEISGRLSQNVTRTIREATGPMTQAFENFVTVSTQEQMRFLDRVVARFVDRMDSSLSGQLTRMSQAMDKAASDQERSARLMEQSVSGMGRLAQDLTDMQTATGNMLRKFEEYADMLKQSRSESDEVLERMAATMESIDIVSRQQTSHLKNVNNLQREMMAAMDEFRAASGAFMHQMHETGSRTAEGMHMAADEMHAAGEMMARTQQQLTGQINADLKDAFDSFEQYMAEFTRRIEQVTNVITASVQELPRAVDATSNQFLDEMDRLTGTLRAATDRMNRQGR